jgi:hypothetical protein
MKFEDEDPEVIQLELKYCERCGALWLRLRGAQEVYCGPCDLEVLDLPSPRRAPSKPRLPGNHKIEGKKQESLPAFCGQGGTA